MSAEVFHVRLLLEEGFRVLAEEGQVVVLCELRALGVLPHLCDLTGVYETVDVGRYLLVPLEVSQTVYELGRGERGIKQEKVKHVGRINRLCARGAGGGGRKGGWKRGRRR